jgi:hypothetical protein
VRVVAQPQHARVEDGQDLGGAEDARVVAGAGDADQADSLPPDEAGAALDHRGIDACRCVWRQRRPFPASNDADQ